MTVLYGSLAADSVPKLQSILDSRPEPCASGVAVANKVLPKKRRMVTVNSGPGTGSFDTLDDTTLRINVYADDEADAEDLANLVRAIVEASAPLGIIDGDPIVRAKVSAGPVEVPNDTNLFQWYMVANVTRRGTQFT